MSKFPSMQYSCDKVALRTTASKMSNLGLSKQGQLVCLYFYYSENLNWSACGARVGHSCDRNMYLLASFQLCFLPVFQHTLFHPMIILLIRENEQ